MLEKMGWDHDSNCFVGQVDFDSKLHFNSYDDLLTFSRTKVLAGYVQGFLICPLDCALPSAFRIAGLFPTDLRFTQQTLHSWMRGVVDSHRAAGFQFVLARQADNASTHGKEMGLTMLPGAAGTGCCV